jgi:hypothetical protein
MAKLIALKTVVNNIDKLISIYKPTYIKTESSIFFAPRIQVVNQTGVKSMISQFYKSNVDPKYKQNDYMLSMDDSDFSALSVMSEPTIPTYVDPNSIEHDKMVLGLHRSAILARNGYRCISLEEIFVGDKDLTVSISDKKKITPCGFIDFICVNDDNEIVIGDVKTCTTYYTNTLTELLIKQDHARQLHIYGRLLEFMGKKYNIDIKVSHYLILGYWNPKNPPDNFVNKIGLWKIHNNKSKWLDANNSKLTFLPINFSDSSKIVNDPKNEDILAVICNPMKKKEDLILCFEKATQSYIVAYENKVLIRFSDLEEAHKWISVFDIHIMNKLLDQNKESKSS